MQPKHDLEEAAHFDANTLKWVHVSWFILYEPRTRKYRKSTKGYYYYDAWHPVAVDQDAFVVDDFGQLIRVWKQPN